MLNDYIEKVHLFEDDYRNIEIIETIPEYLAQRKDVRSIIKLLEGPTTGTSKDVHKEEYVEELSEKIRDLETIHLIFEDARPELNKRIQKERKNTRRFIITTVIALLGIFVTIAITLY